MSLTQSFASVCHAGAAARRALEALSSSLDWLATQSQSEAGVTRGLLAAVPEADATDATGSPVADAYAAVQGLLVGSREELAGQAEALEQLAAEARNQAREAAGLALALPVAELPTPAPIPSGTVELIDGEVVGDDADGVANPTLAQMRADEDGETALEQFARRHLDGAIDEVLCQRAAELGQAAANDPEVEAPAAPLAPAEGVPELEPPTSGKRPRRSRKAK